MRIAILGAGAMGMLFSGYLSQKNEVWVIDVDKSRVDKINRDGVLIRESDGSDRCFHVKAVADSSGLPEMDLIIVFVKAMYSISALETNKHLIGKNSYLMTLQNGAGHEAKLLQFVDADHVIIGSTQNNSSVIANGHANHGGSGASSIGALTGDSKRLDYIAENMTQCGFETVTSNEVKKQIWTKLFTNTSASSLTAVLQVPLGFLCSDPYAHELMIKLCREAVAVANAGGFAKFDDAEAIEGVETVCRNAPNGYTSIYMDIKNGNRTEVDTISGSVVETARELGVDVPCHEAIVALIHALEDKSRPDKA